MVQGLEPVNQEGARIRTEIGRRLREERDRLGLSQTAFAATAGASKRAQISWEKGAQSPNAETLAGMAKAGADVLYIVTGIRAPHPGVSIGLSHREADLLEALRYLPEADQAAVHQILSSMASLRAFVRGETSSGAEGEIKPADHGGREGEHPPFRAA